MELTDCYRDIKLMWKRFHFEINGSEMEISAKWNKYTKYQKREYTASHAYNDIHSVSVENWDKLTKVFDEVSLSQKNFTKKDSRIDAIILW